jgi:lipopolysaccharide biosynthesis protein
LVDEGDLFDEIITCNDSVYAPLFPLGEMFAVMEGSQAPYWGVTSNSEFARHIQSYFIAFRRPVLEREEFWQFWNDVGLQPNKSSLIEAYEVGLSVLLERLGLAGASYFSLDELLNDALVNFKCFSVLPVMASPYSSRAPLEAERLLMGWYNKTLVLWKELIFARTPMIKIQLLRDNPTDQPIGDVLAALERHSLYPVQLIRDHLYRMHSGERNRDPSQMTPFFAGLGQSAA